MAAIHGLEDWKLDKKITDGERTVEVSIYFTYPEIAGIMDLRPKERVNWMQDYHQGILKKLVALNLFDTYKIKGKKKNPRGLNTKMNYNSLSALTDLDYISSVFVENINYAKKVEKKKKILRQYFCVKMTVVIEIEGIKSKKQEIETRFVLIKADSFEDAYDKLEKQKSDYAEPYLNTDGRLVRWRIDSFDDCYITDINNSKELDGLKGVEVYSKLKSRKLKLSVSWDGTL